MIKFKQIKLVTKREERKKDQMRLEYVIFVRCLRNQYIQGKEKTKKPALTPKRRKENLSLSSPD